MYSLSDNLSSGDVISPAFLCFIGRGCSRISLGLNIFCLIVSKSTEMIVILLTPLLARSNFQESVETGTHLDPLLKEVVFNPTYETMFAPEVTLFHHHFTKTWHIIYVTQHFLYVVLLQFGPSNPFQSQQTSAPRNMLAGYAEPAHVNDFMFEQQRRTFSTFGRLLCEKSPQYSKYTMIYFRNVIASVLFVGYALDPSVDTHQVSSVSYIGAVDEAEKNKGNLDIFNSQRVILFVRF